MFRRIAHAAITLYQTTISPDHGILRALFPAGVCRFTPTCSEYMRQAIDQRGWRGFWHGLRRVGRCHPWSPGGYDPV